MTQLRYLAAAFTVSALALAGCGDGSSFEANPNPNDNGDVNTPTPKEIPTPRIDRVTPAEFSVSDDVSIYGADFIGGDLGRTELVFNGEFVLADGTSELVENLRIAPEFVQTGLLRMHFGPDVLFDPQGDRIGTFQGSLTAENKGHNGDVKPAAAGTSITLGVKPSVLIRQVRPQDSGCAPTVSDTLEDLPLVIVAEAVGLKPATELEPLFFTFTFNAPDIAYEGSHAIWSGNSWEWVKKQLSKLVGTYTVTPEDLTPPSGPIKMDMGVYDGTIAVLQGDRDIDVLVNDTKAVELDRLATGFVPDGAQRTETSISVRVEDADGNVAFNHWPLTFHRLVEFRYDGNVKIRERFEPILVTDCIPGGDIGREVSYSETASESRSRTISYNWRFDLSATYAPIKNDPFKANITASIGFGTDVSATVSSDKSESLSINGRILPGLFGAFYRQTAMQVKQGEMIGHTECGIDEELGNAVLTDWIFTPDLATGPRCIPATNLPAAGVFDD